MLAASVIVPIILMIVLSWLSYRVTIVNAQHDLERVSQVARENVGMVFNSQSQLVDYVNDLVRNLDPDTIIADEFSLHQTLVRLISRLPDVVSVMVVSKTGVPLVNAGSYPINRNVNLSDRDYFKAMIGGSMKPYVSHLQTGLIYQKPFFGLGRPWTGPDGTVKGVIDVAVSPDFFLSFYHNLLAETDDNLEGRVIALMRDDGHILVRYPQYDGPPPAADAAVNFLASVSKSPDGGIFESNSLITNPPRLFAYRKVPSYPLYIAAGRSWNVIMAEWHRSVLIHLLVGVPATCMFFTLTRQALTRALREQQALRLAQREVARREIAEDTLLRAQRLEAVGQMTGGVAHDFNNLLTVILGNATMIEQRTEDPSRIKRLAASIQLAAKRGADITQQLLAFAGRQTVRPETISLNQRLIAFKPLLDHAASGALQIEFDLDPALKPVTIDPGQFESAILNLVGNARDAMPNGGTVMITTSNVSAFDLSTTVARHEAFSADGPQHVSSGPGVRVTVSDTGSGMDRETVTKAFEPFFTTKEVGKGTGLGLSQVYGFARQAGGLVRIVSTLGKGTNVEIMLPVASQTLPAEHSEPANAANPQPNSGKVVLVVEDEQNVLDTTVETLHDLGYQTLAVKNGCAALEYLRKADQIDLLFTDIVMPGGMTGIQLMSEAKRLHPKLRVVLTSGYTGSARADLPTNVPLLVKPYSHDQLLRKLEAIFQQ